MIAILFAAALHHAKPSCAVKTTGQTGGVTTCGVVTYSGPPLVTDANLASTTSSELEICGADPNRPDLTVCIAGYERRIRLFMPYPPCGTPEAKTAPQCAEWKIGRPR